MSNNVVKSISSDFRRYYMDHREEIVRLVPDQARIVLDIGCGGGEVGYSLKKRGVEFVAGIEANHQAAIIAREKMDNVIEGDVENMRLPFKTSYFDCIILADILEHLCDPWCLLENLKSYLAENGLFVCSIPNIGHYSIIKKLLFHKWEYAKEGILDKTHLRFFTLSSIKDMFHKGGLEIVHIQCNYSAPKIIRYGNIILFGALYRVFKQYLCEQYIFTAKKA